MLQGVEILKETVIHSTFQKFMAGLFVFFTILFAIIVIMILYNWRRNRTADLAGCFAAALVMAIAMMITYPMINHPMAQTYEYVIRIDKKSENNMYIHVLYDVVETNDDIWTIRTSNRIVQQEQPK